MIPAVLNTKHTDFLLVRHGRAVIRDAAMRVDHPSHMSRCERTCPLQEMFYRRAGMRVVGPELDLAVHS